MRRLLLSSVLLATLTGSPAVAVDPTIAISDDGLVYRPVVGPYRVLFPEGTAGLGGTSVLAIDVAHPDGSAERRLVPASTGSDIEGAASLFALPGSNELIVVWESRFQGVFSQLLVARYEPGGGWSPALEVLGNPFATKTGVAVLATRDTVSIAGGAERRLVVHLLWCEGDPGSTRCSYVPVTRLGDLDFAVGVPLDLETALGDVVPLASDLGRVGPTLGLGNGRIVGAFPRGASGALATVAIRVAPSELRLLADSLAAELDQRLLAGASPGELAADVRAHIIRQGSEVFQSALLADISAAIEADLQRWAAAPQVDREILVAEVRAHIIRQGLTALDGPVLRDSGPLRAVVDSRGLTPDSLFLAGVTERSLRPLPEVGTQPKLMLSPSGANAIVAWTEGRFLRYRESVEGGWSEERSLATSPGLTADMALAMLAQRAQQLD